MRVAVALAAAAYVAVSAAALFVLWMHTGFCDTAENDCSLPWTTSRVALWVLWSLVGIALLPAAAIALRPKRGPLAQRPIAFAVAVAVLLAGLVVALALRATAP